MASPKARRTPIAIFEDEVSGDDAHEDSSSADEDGPQSEHETGHNDDYESHDDLSQHEDVSENDADFEDEEHDRQDQDELSPSVEDVSDPFTASELLRQPPHVSGADEPVKSVEGLHSPQSSEGSFSTTSRIHIDESVDPHLDYIAPSETPTPDENYPNPLDSALIKHGAYTHDDNRKTSESVSTLPDELDYYRSSIPGRPALSPYQARSTHATPQKSMPYGPQHSRSNSAIRHDSRPFFRSPSSVRAMQMSSPPPFPATPRSATQKRASPRHIRQSNSPFVPHSREGTPTRRRHKTAPPEESKPAPEFPLVLLHCTLHMIHTPAGYPAEALEDCRATERVIRDSALLKAKMDPTVMDRGVLIQHPGDDYEVLEERVLESLELKRPRIGACGHFRQSTSTQSTSTAAASDTETEEYKAHCPDCAAHLSHHILSESEQRERRRWEVKVYAANGLMRSGAWSAAWREMEKIDIEVGVWLGREDAGLAGRLEDWARQREAEEEEAARLAVEREAPRPIEAVLRETMRFSMPDGGRGREERSPPSTAHVERPGTAKSGSRHALPFEGTHVENSRSVEDAGEQARAASATPIPPTDPLKDSSIPHVPQGELPLTTLLTNYVHRLFSKNQSFVVPGLILLLALYVASSGVLTSKRADALVASPVAPTATVTEMAQPVTQTQTVEVSVTPTAIREATECECDFEAMLEARGVIAVEKGEIERFRGLNEKAKKFKDEQETDAGELDADEGTEADLSGGATSEEAMEVGSS